MADQPTRDADTVPMEEPEFWDEYETGNEHYRCSVCGNIGPIPATSEERQRRRAEHLAERHSDGTDNGS